MAAAGRAGVARRAIFGIFAVLITANLAAWTWASFAFRFHPVLLGTALLAYGLGLRHAVDADHIAAIDNVTRKLMQEGRRPALVGFYFSFGHSTVVVLASAAIAASATAFGNRLGLLRDAGSVVGTLVSASFLLAIAAINLVILAGIHRSFRRVKAGTPYRDEDLDALLAGRGLLARLFRSLFGMVRHSWHMYPLGFLFGLGFDTASEVALLGISATEAARGLPVWSILVFPALFAAGMLLVDTTDGILMLGAYGWAFVNPVRKLYYNMTITLVSALVALVVGGIEGLGLVQSQLDLGGPFWSGIGALNEDLGIVGYLVIGILVGGWAVSVVVYRIGGYDRIEIDAGG
jgi:high-affinity nickel-transport protein